MTVSIASSFRLSKNTRQLFASAEASSSTTATAISLTSFLGRWLSIIASDVLFRLFRFAPRFRFWIGFGFFGQPHAVFIAQRRRVGALGNFYILLSKSDKWTPTSIKHLHIRVFIEGLDGLFSVFLSLLLNDSDGLLFGHIQRLNAFRNGIKLFIVQDIRTEPADIHLHFLVFKESDLPRHFEQFQRLFQLNGFNGLVSAQTGIFGLFLFTAVSQLHKRTVPADANRYPLPAHRINPQLALAGSFVGLLQGLFNILAERTVKFLQHPGPLFHALGYLIEFLFDPGGKMVIHDAVKMLQQEVVDYRSYITGKKFVFLGAGDLGCDFLLNTRGRLRPLRLTVRKDPVITGFPLPVFLGYITPLLDRRNRGCIGGWPSNPQFLQFFNQT